MIRASRRARHRSQIRFVIAGSMAVLSLMAVSATPALSAPGSYEPNDTIAGSVGPLSNHQSYAAALEAENDKDFFFFYVTSPASPVTVTLKNLGSPFLSYVGVSILDSSGTSVGSVTNVEEGDEKAVTVTLEPQKYFVEVMSNLDYGAEYSLGTEGGTGAFGPYAAIASHCAAARSASATAQVGLEKAEAKLQRTTARLRRSRYSARGARRSAQSAYRKAKARTAAKRKAVAAARAAQRPWCFIPQ